MAAARPDIAITALGLHSSLGRSSDAAAGYRCGLSRAEELQGQTYMDEDMVEPQLLIGHPAAHVNDGFQGLGRLIKLGGCALEDLAGHVDVGGLDPARLGLLLALPDEQDPCQQLSVSLHTLFANLLQKLSVVGGLTSPMKHVSPYFEGRLGLVSAFAHAMSLLRAGEVDYCLVGAIDTLLDTSRLERLSAAAKIKRVDNPVGLCPGEGASFVLLESAASAQARGRPVLAFLHEPARTPKGDESRSNSPPPDPSLQEPLPVTGRELADVMKAALEQACITSTETGTIFADLNGETLRAADFGSALVRIPSKFALRQWRQEFPAVSFGDTGAVAGLLAICLAIRAFLRGYAVGNAAMVTLAGDDASRGAILIRSA